MAYGELKSEGELETSPLSSKPPLSWPDEGKIEITDLCYRHHPDAPFALHGLNCTINSGEKVCYKKQ